MSLKLGEINVKLYVNVNFDVNEAPFTAIKLHFSSPGGAITFTRENPLVTAPNVNSDEIDGGGCGCNGNTGTILRANEYLVYMVQDGDFTVTGDWTVCSEYQDTSSVYYGDPTTLTVVDNCLP